jgi:isoleucyl-tRNA synthetase
MLVRLLAPIMSFTAEEVWQFLPSVGEKPESVHLALFPTPEEVLGNTARASQREEQVPADGERIRAHWDRLLQVRSEVLKALENARNQKVIGSGLEAKVVITAPADLYELLNLYRETLRYLFIVSQVELKQSSSGNGSGLKVEVLPADGQKCERCWNYSTLVGSDTTYPTVCERCSAALGEIKPAF